VLEGSVRKVGERVRISAQLAEGISGRQLGRSATIANYPTYSSCRTRSRRQSSARSSRSSEGRAPALGWQRPDNLDAWDLYQRGMSHLYEYTKDDLQRARQYFAQAIARDPQLGPAHSGLAETYYYEGVYGFADSITDNREKALAPACGQWCSMPRMPARTVRWGEPTICAAPTTLHPRELKTALELNPSLALAHYGLGATLVFAGRAEEGIPYLTAAIRLSPHDPNMGSFLVRLADAAYF